MNEEDNFFDAEIISEEEDEPQTVSNGLCPKCYGSGFPIVEVDGVLGVLYTKQGDDDTTRSLMRCDCNTY